MYVCMHVRMYVCVYVCMYVHTEGAGRPDSLDGYGLRLLRKYSSLRSSQVGFQD